VTGIASGGVLYNSDIQVVLDPSWLSRLTRTEAERKRMQNEVDWERATHIQLRHVPDDKLYCLASATTSIAHLRILLPQTFS